MKKHSISRQQHKHDNTTGSNSSHTTPSAMPGHLKGGRETAPARTLTRWKCDLGPLPITYNQSLQISGDDPSHRTRAATAHEPGRPSNRHKPYDELMPSPCTLATSLLFLLTASSSSCSPHRTTQRHWWPKLTPCASSLAYCNIRQVREVCHPRKRVLKPQCFPLCYLAPRSRSLPPWSVKP
jgi:hypothetical protein